MKSIKSSIYIVFLTLFISTVLASKLSEISHDCDIVQGFNFTSSSQKTFGFLKDLQIGTTELNKDLSVLGPNNETMKVTGVLSNIYWQDGAADPIQVSAQVSILNKNLITLFLHSNPTDISVKFSFVVYKYDPIDQQYFKCFYHSTSLLDGNILKTGNTLSLYIEDEASYEVPSPINFYMQISIAPESQIQALEIAISPSAKYARPWGGGTSSLTTKNEIMLLKQPELLPAYPNPFNPQLTIDYNLPNDTDVTLIIYDIMGHIIQVLVDKPQRTGSYKAYWNGENKMRDPVASGMYLIILNTGTIKRIQKVLLMR